MQLTYRGVRVQPQTAGVKAFTRKLVGAYRGLPLSFRTSSKSQDGATTQHHALKYRGVSYEH